MAQLAGLELPDATLAAYAARLGSDCAFFVYNRPMFGSGRGEVLEPFAIDLSQYRLEVVVPEGIAVSTAEAYRGITPRIPEKALREVLRQDIVDGIRRSSRPGAGEGGTLPKRRPLCRHERQRERLFWYFP